MTELQTGDILIGRYTLQKLLRQARDIAVWQATDRVLAHDCQVVLITDAELAAQASEIAGLLALHRSPYFTPIEQIRNAEGSALLVTALDSGTSVLRFILRAKTHQTQTCSFEAMRTIMAQTLEAVKVARAQGFNVPTISPAMIRVAPTGVTLADVPLAYALTPLVAANGAAGATTLSTSQIAAQTVSQAVANTASQVASQTISHTASQTARNTELRAALDSETSVVRQLAATLCMMLTGDQLLSSQSYNPQLLREITFDHQLFSRAKVHIPEEFAILCERGLGLHAPGTPTPVPISTLDEFSALLGDYTPMQELTVEDIQFPTRGILQSIELVDFLDTYTDDGNANYGSAAHDSAAHDSAARSNTAGNKAVLGTLPRAFAPERPSAVASSATKTPEWTRTQLFSGHSEVEEATFEDFEQEDGQQSWSYYKEPDYKFTDKLSRNNGYSGNASSAVNDLVNGTAGAAGASLPTVNLAQAAQEARRAAMPTISLDATAIRHPNIGQHGTSVNADDSTLSADTPTDAQGSNASGGADSTSIAAESAEAIQDLSRLAKGGTQSLGTPVPTEHEQHIRSKSGQPFVDPATLEADEEAPTQNIFPVSDGPITVAQYAEQVRKAEQAKRAAQLQEQRFEEEEQNDEAQQNSAKKAVNRRIVIAVCIVAVLVALGVWAASALGVFEDSAEQPTQEQTSNWPSINTNDVPFPNDNTGDSSNLDTTGNAGSKEQSSDSKQSSDKDKDAAQSKSKNTSKKSDSKSQSKQQVQKSSKTTKNKADKAKVTTADKKATAVPAPKQVNTTAYATVRQTFINRPGDLKGRGWYVRLDSPHDVSRLVISIRQSGGKGYIYAGASTNDPTSGQQVGEFTFDPSGTTQVQLTKQVQTQDIVIWVPVDSTPVSASGAQGLYFNSVEVY